MSEEELPPPLWEEPVPVDEEEDRRRYHNPIRQHWCLVGMPPSRVKESR